ncbi:MAG: AraC family transcriptional regulator [Litorimonas sp.]
MLWPMFWFYIEGLTQETRWRFNQRHVLHLIPSLFGLLAAGLVALLPQTTRLSFFGEDDPILITPLAVIAMIFLALVIVIWFFQLIIYTILGLRRLFKYRRRLKDVFASTENKELTWLFVLFSCLGLTCIYAILNSFFPSLYELGGPFSAVWEELVLMSFLFALAVWGLRQSPGFEPLYTEQEKVEKSQASNQSEDPKLIAASDRDQKEKYEKSGLDGVRADRISRKLEKIMETEELYLNPNLSLPMLARRLGVSTNILSQTLNQTIECSFFDYVNKYRIAASLPMITQRNNTILTIAISVGFNSRSAFYKAFKREIGTTPTSYLKKDIAKDMSVVL